MKCYFWNPCGDQRWQDEQPSWALILILNLKIFWAICLCKQSSTDWSTIHNLILKICPKFKFSVLTFLGSINCLMSNEQKLCLVKKFKLQSMSNAIKYIDKRFTVNKSGISCLARLALIFNLSNPRWSTNLHICSWLLDENRHVPVLLEIDMKSWLNSQVVASGVAWVLFQLGAENLCSPSAILLQSVYWHTHSYIAASVAISC